MIRTVLSQLQRKLKPLGFASAIAVWLPTAIWISTSITQSQPPQDTEAASKLIGTKARDWQVRDWLNSNPIQLRDLSGKVVLVRWWTVGCPLCVATAPSLSEFYAQFHSRGLEVIGFYHHKSDERLDVDRVHHYAKQLGFKFPVAVDYDWQTLKSWWLNRTQARWTSVSFLIDRKGIIRHIHPGGQYVQDDDDYKAMKAKIEQLLAER